MYKPGLHLIASLQCSNLNYLEKADYLKSVIDQQIAFHQLQNLGEVYHQFVPGGFTAIVCLSESHISAHSWPEHGLLNIDIYLSNFQRVNNGVVTSIFTTIVDKLEATILNHQEIVR